MRLIRIPFTIVAFIVIMQLQVLFASGNPDTPDEKILSVYCYDSFSSEWGAGPEIARAFSEETGIKVLYKSFGDGINVLNQLIIEKEKPRGDVVVGLDSSLLSRSLDAGILEPYKPPLSSKMASSPVFDQTYHLIPFDYGHFAICYDSDVLASPPISLEDLCSERFTSSLILMDPRNSTPGLGFLLWTIAIYGDRWTEYWQRLKPSILTITEGWSQGYALFVAGEAPMILSYGTSPVYHAEYENSTRYKAANFTDGHLLQIEGMGIIKGTQNRYDAERFIDFLLENTSQLTLAVRNIMFPVNAEVELPKSFDMALRPEKIIHYSEIIENTADKSEKNDLIDRWIRIFHP